MQKRQYQSLQKKNHRRLHYIPQFKYQSLQKKIHRRLHYMPHVYVSITSKEESSQAALHASCLRINHFKRRIITGCITYLMFKYQSLQKKIHRRLHYMPHVYVSITSKQESSQAALHTSCLSINHFKTSIVAGCITCLMFTYQSLQNKNHRRLHYIPHV